MHECVCKRLNRSERVYLIETAVSPPMLDKLCFGDRVIARKIIELIIFKCIPTTVIGAVANILLLLLCTDEVITNSIITSNDTS